MKTITEKLLDYLNKVDVREVESITLIDGPIQDEMTFSPAPADDGTEQHLTGSSMEIEGDLPEGGSTIKAKNVIDARKESLNYKLVYDAKRKCYIRVKK